MSQRQPAVQGLFYPNSKALLEKQLLKAFPKTDSEGKSIACVSAHAGLVYSGEIAGKSISSLKKTQSYIILCPNHTGLGEKISVSPSAEWQTMLGTTATNTEIAKRLTELLPEAKFDESAHSQEHSAEMQLLLLQKKFRHDFKIVVVCIAEQDLQILKRLGEALVELHKQHDFCVIASSDFTHFESEESAERKDKEAINYIINNRVEGFYNCVVENELSICGFAGITSLLEFCSQKKLKGKLLEYHTSAKTTKDKTNVVGYASIVWE